VAAATNAKIDFDRKTAAAAFALDKADAAVHIVG